GSWWGRGRPGGGGAWGGCRAASIDAGVGECPSRDAQAPGLDYFGTHTVTPFRPAGWTVRNRPTPDVSNRRRSAQMTDLSPARIMEVGMAFWSAKVLLSAVELGLFTNLGANALTGPALRSVLDLHRRAA